MSPEAKPSQPRETPPAAKQDLPLHRRINCAGVVILAAGLTGAALIYLFAADDAAPVTEIGDRRVNEFQIERIGGMAAVYAVRFNQWLGSLWHGRQLAFTIGVLAIVIALVCFWVASVVSARSPGDQDERDAMKNREG